MLAISVCVTALLDLDLTSPRHSRSKQTPPNERPYMTSYPSLKINLTVSARGSKLWPSEIRLTSILPFQVKVNSNKWKGIYDFLSIISNKFGRICQCYQVTALGNMLDLDLTSPGHSRSKQMSPNERPYIISYPSSNPSGWGLTKLRK